MKTLFLLFVLALFAACEKTEVENKPVVPIIEGQNHYIEYKLLNVASVQINTASSSNDTIKWLKSQTPFFYSFYSTETTNVFLFVNVIAVRVPTQPLIGQIWVDGIMVAEDSSARYGKNIDLKFNIK